MTAPGNRFSIWDRTDVAKGLAGEAKCINVSLLCAKGRELISEM